MIAAQGSQARDRGIIVVDMKVAPECARMDMIESSLLVDGVFEPSGGLPEESLLSGGGAPGHGRVSKPSSAESRIGEDTR